RSARRLRSVRFDVVHHLTWGGIRAPTFLGGLGIPLIIGPLGGGETSPKKIRKGLTPRARLTELLRDISNRTTWINPLLRPGLSAASLIYVRTEESRRILPSSLQPKIIKFGELTIRPHFVGI